MWSGTAWTWTVPWAGPRGKAQERVFSLAPAHLERCRQVLAALLEPTVCPSALQTASLTPCSTWVSESRSLGVPGTSTHKELCEGRTRTDSAFWLICIYRDASALPQFATAPHPQGIRASYALVAGRNITTKRGSWTELFFADPKIKPICYYEPLLSGSHFSINHTKKILKKDIYTTVLTHLKWKNWYK